MVYYHTVFRSILVRRTYEGGIEEFLISGTVGYILFQLHFLLNLVQLIIFLTS